MTEFYVRDDRKDGISDKCSRKFYKAVARDNSSRGLPLRVHTIYVGGVPTKTLILLPLPVGSLM